MNRKKAINFFEFMLHCFGRTNMKAKDTNTVAAFELAVAALKEQEERENQKPLTLEELVNMDAPVWAGNRDFPGAGGFWCLCQNGCIVCPSGQMYGADELPSWVFYRYEPKGE